MKDKFICFDDNCNKYTRGKTAIIGGSRGMTGAVVLSARAASRSGCGLVVACVPESLNNIFEIKLTEEMTFPVKDVGGVLSCGNFDSLMVMLEKCNSMAIGMGASCGREVKRLLKLLLREFNKPIILDADALNIIAEKPFYIEKRANNLIMTPHVGEFSRILGIPAEEIENNREYYAKKYASDNKLVLLLKGKNTIVTDGEKVYINDMGNKGMAKGGSGDVLSGIIASLASQGMDLYDSTVMGCKIHSMAGDIACEKYTDMAMTAGDIIKCLPDAFKKMI